VDRDSGLEPVGEATHPCNQGALGTATPAAEKLRPTMEAKISRLSKNYEAALRANLKQGHRADYARAHALGHQAVVLGLETLDITKMHEKALRAMALKSPPQSASAQGATVNRSEMFFAETILPIEKTHRAALADTAHLNKLVAMLHRSTVGLAKYNRHLKRGIAKRTSAEKALKESGKRNATLLEESHRQRQHSRRIVHKMLSKHEVHRGKISKKLYDNVAQTLLGIDVRLAALKRKSAVNLAALQEEVVSTQRLVTKSAKTMDFDKLTRPRIKKSVVRGPAGIRAKRPGDKI
jgi:hypothetical protein